jgi:predicted DNA-binding transcriptional regulator YafY
MKIHVERHRSTISMSYDLFRQAIIGKKQIVCFYRGYQREVCPHAIGLKRGHRHVLVYQFGGGSSSGLSSGGEWRCMEVDDVTNAAVRDGPWHTGQRHTQRQTCVDQIDVEIIY